MTLVKKFTEAPLELKAYAIFATLTTILSFILPKILPKETWEQTIQYTGWSPAMVYMFTLFPIFTLIFRYNQVKYIKYAIILPLAIGICSGFQQQLLADERSTTTNPYLMVSQYQYIWTMLIPALWILVFLFSSKIMKFSEVNFQKSF